MATRKSGRPDRQDVEIDPYRGYGIKSANSAYKGESHGIEFLNGKARLDGLSRDTDEDEVEERRQLLLWFTNGEPAKLPAGYELDHDGKPIPLYEWKRPYTLEPDAEPARKEKAGASA